MLTYARKCRLLLNPAFPREYQHDAFSSDGLNIREQAENEPVSCKAWYRISKNETAGAATTAPAAHFFEFDSHRAAINTPKVAGTAIIEGLPKPIKSVCRVLGYALALATPEAWEGFQMVLEARLSKACRILLAANVLATLNHEDAGYALSLSHPIAGTPRAPFAGLMDEATFWASIATPAELKAYCLSSYLKLSASDQAAFLNYVQRSAV